MKIILSPNLFLYPFDASHTGLLADWLADRKAIMEFGGPDLKAPLDSAQLTRRSPGERPGSDRRIYSVSTRTVGMLAGHGAVLDIDHVARTGRLARVLLAPMFRGQGFGHELVSLLCAAAFDIVRVETLRLHVPESSAAAIACFGNVGFDWTDAEAQSLRIGRKRVHVREMQLGSAVWESHKPEWASALFKGEDCCSH